MTTILRANQVQSKLKNREEPILDDINLKIDRGDFITVLGPNGSGKTSLIKILSGEVASTSGEILLNEIPIERINYKKKAQDVLTLTQRPEDRLFLDLTIEENITMWQSRSTSSADSNIKSASKLFHERFIAKFTANMNQKVLSLSGGEKQVLLMLLVAAYPPKILFLDEHTSALDFQATKEIMAITAQTVAKNKITTIMITHHIADALEYSNRIIILNKGKIISDYIRPFQFSVEELKANIIL